MMYFVVETHNPPGPATGKYLIGPSPAVQRQCAGCKGQRGRLNHTVCEVRKAMGAPQDSGGHGGGQR